MLEILDPQNTDPVAYDKGVLKKIKEFSLLPGNRIGWNYCMDYVWLAMRVEGKIRKGMKIVDIGAGPGAIHGYLENKYKVKILGIDMQRWSKDYVDVVGDFSDARIRGKAGIEDNSLDLIISTSSFEHNRPRDHKRLVDVCMRTLKLGGSLVTTFSVSPTNKTTFYKPSTQWNLSRIEVEKIYNDKFRTFNYGEVWGRWRNHREIPDAFLKRYGEMTARDPLFLSVGASKRRNKN